MTRWYKAGSLAGLPGLPGSRRKINARAAAEGWDRPDWRWDSAARRGHWRPARGKGGGVEYAETHPMLPAAARARLTALAAARAEADPAPAPREEVWARFEAAGEAARAEARRRLGAVDAAEALIRGGTGRGQAARIAARDAGCGVRTLQGWQRALAGVRPDDRIAYLLPHRVGRTRTAACDPAAWEMFKSDYLRPERPSMASCYRRLRAAAETQGWRVPALRTLERRLEREVPAAAIALARHGAEALKRIYPAQERDRSGFHALEAVNADGHQWDVWVEWPDGEIGRPCMVATQDLYSGKVLTWRLDRTENKETVRLAFGDLVEAFGVPSIAYLDNGRGFASKWLTGGAETRYRFKIRDEDPAGLLTLLGVDVHWTTPYSGQSKPIERAFRDFCDSIAKHPALAGAWTGNSPVNKPENYRSRAVPFDLFERTVAAGIAEHNARPGRQAKTASGRSFDAVFAESYAAAPVRKATAAQRRLWLLAAEGVRARRPDGALHLLGNRYWDAALTQHIGQPLVARFDPAALHDGVHVYRLDGTYLVFADCIEAVGFADVAAARAHGRARRAHARAVRDQLDAARTLTPDEVAALLPDAAPAAPPESRIVRLVDRPALATRPTPRPAPLSERQADAHARVVETLAERRPPAAPETAETRYARAQAAEAAQAEGRALAPEEARWLAGYLRTAEYRAQKKFAEARAAFEARIETSSAG